MCTLVSGEKQASGFLVSSFLFEEGFRRREPTCAADEMQVQVRLSDLSIFGHDLELSSESVDDAPH